MKTIPSLSPLALMRGNVARIVIGGACLGMTAAIGTMQGGPAVRILLIRRAEVL